MPGRGRKVTSGPLSAHQASEVLRQQMEDDEVVNQMEVEPEPNLAELPAAEQPRNDNVGIGAAETMTKGAVLKLLQGLRVAMKEEIRSEFRGEIEVLKEQVGALTLQVKTLEEKVLDPEQRAPTSLKVHKDLRDMISEAHESLEENARYQKGTADDSGAVFGFKAPHNKETTAKIKEKVLERRTWDAQLLHYACRRKFESYTRKQMEDAGDDAAEKKVEKNLQERRKALLKRRAKFVRPTEEENWAGMTHHVMSDEEDAKDDDRNPIFLRRSPVWRCPTLSLLMRQLDARVLASHQQSKTGYTTRKLGQASRRHPPTSLPDKFLMEGWRELMN